MNVKLSFTPVSQNPVDLLAVVLDDEKTLHEIDYPHILPQVYYTPAEVKMIPLDVKTTAKTVGYIKGGGMVVRPSLARSIAR